VLFARPFTLETPYAYTWTAEQTSITSGYVLVVEVEPELARVKSTWNPVLYAGRYPAEITSSDPETGRVVVIVPGDLDLSRDPVFFGSVELPDRVTAERGRQELAAARAVGYAPLTAEALRLALQAGGERATLRDAGYLYGGPVADAIERYVPSQASVADGYRVPRVETR
jgi:hypothetical protein